MFKTGTLTALAVVALSIVGCGGGGSGSSFGTSLGSSLGSQPDNPHLLQVLQVPNVSGASKAFSFDAGLVDGGRYYLTDRNNKAIDVFDTRTNTFITQITGKGTLAFTGDGKSTDQSGPNSISRAAGTSKIYATDVNSVKVIDTSTNLVTGSIPIFDAAGLPTGNRADGSCYDKDDHLLMVQNSADSFATWIDTNTDTVVTRFDFPDSTSGLEVCVYDSASKKFFVNNDGTATNPNGELDSITAVSIMARTPTLVDRFALGKCNPNGLDLGPGGDIIVACDPSGTEGSKLITQILDRNSGRILATIPFGGSDLVSYDPGSNRYYLGSRNWQATGIVDKAQPKAPVLGIIDAGSRSLFAGIPAGTNDHGITVDAANGQIYVPFTSTAGSADFASSGIAIYSIK